MSSEYMDDLWTIQHKYAVGQRVMWRGGFGTEPAKPARIIGLGDKRGRPLYDLDNGHWAYETQIDSVIDAIDEIDDLRMGCENCGAPIDTDKVAVWLEDKPYCENCCE